LSVDVFLLKGFEPKFTQILITLGRQTDEFQDNGVKGQVYTVTTTDILISYEPLKGVEPKLTQYFPHLGHELMGSTVWVQQSR